MLEEYGIRINTDKSKVMILSKQTGMAKDDGCKQIKQDNISENLYSLFRYNGGCTEEIESQVTCGRASFKIVRKLILAKS